jgi:rod shape-determining protein MreD
MATGIQTLDGQSELSLHRRTRKRWLTLRSNTHAAEAHFPFWAAVAMPFVVILIQIYFRRFFPVLDFLNLPLLAVLYYSMSKRSQIAGLLAGALVGMAQDALSTSPLGITGIILTLVGYFMAGAAIRFDLTRTLVRLPVLVYLSLFHRFVSWVMDRAILAHHTSLGLLDSLIFGVVYAGMAFALFSFLDWWRGASRKGSAARIVRVRPLSVRHGVDDIIHADANS